MDSSIVSCHVCKCTPVRPAEYLDCFHCDENFLSENLCHGCYTDGEHLCPECQEMEDNR